jgi:hypothetical protein
MGKGEKKEVWLSYSTGILRMIHELLQWVDSPMMVYLKIDIRAWEKQGGITGSALAIDWFKHVVIGIREGTRHPSPLKLP